MGFLRKTAAILLGYGLVLLLASGCSGSRFRLRIETPAHATLRIPAGVGTPERNLNIPFSAQFDPSYVGAPYPVVILLPADVTRRLGGRGEVQLVGTLAVGNATPLTAGSTVTLPIPEESLRELVSGQVREIHRFVSDQNVELASITLRASNAQ